MSGSGDTAPSSQGSVVSFNGQELGLLLSIRVSGGRAVATDITGVDAAVSGSGADSYIVRERDSTAVDPATVTVTFWGVGPTAEVGDRGTLAVTMDAGSIVSGDAWLAAYEVEANVGEFIQGSATFELAQFAGS